jgi:two-component system cell cycle sensor histidine kinase/response regulator CckA
LGAVNETPTPQRRSAGRRNSDTMLRRVVEMVHLGWWQLELATTDPSTINDNPLTWSDEVYRIFGHQPRAFPATNEAFFKAVHPDDHQAIKDAVQRAIKEGADYQVDHRIIRPDGQIRLIEERGYVERAEGGAPLRLVGTLLDVTERRRIEDAFRGKDGGSQLISQIIEHSHDAIISATLEGVITTWNPAAERIFGWRSEEIIGRSAELFTPAERMIEMRQCLELAAQGKRKDTFESARMRRDGSLVEVAISGSPIYDGQGGIIGISAIIRDITQQKRIAAQLQHAQRLESVGRLAGGVAHDFNNLLMAITGYAELIRMDLPEDAPIQEDLRALLSSTERGARLTRQLLAFGRRQVLNPVTLDLNAVLREMEGVLRPLAGGDVTMRISPCLEAATVIADRAQFEQVVVNLVANARDAMPRGGTLDIETTLVEVGNGNGGRTQHATVEPGTYIRLAVRDTGIGMDADVQSRLFEPFFTTKPRGTSTGMGLATTYGIVKQSGGFITVESEPDKGTTVRAFLPHVPGAEPLEAQDAGDASSDSVVILLCEDDKAVRSSTRAMLERFGYVVLEAEAPSDALAHARNHPGPIHLLLTDIMLPEMPGTRLAELVNELRPGLPVVRMSGFSGSVELIRDEAGRQSFLQKPFTADTLARVVREALAS